MQEIFEAAHTANELPDGFKLESFLDLVQRMVERGFLEVDLSGKQTNKTNLS